jgi:hypothetical protein
VLGLPSFFPSWPFHKLQVAFSVRNRLNRKKSFDLFTAKVPLGLAVAVAQASIYDVPGGFRAVMFDRFAGVKDKVCKLLNETVAL